VKNKNFITVLSVVGVQHSRCFESIEVNKKEDQ
jgi:hypothetical protein